MIIMIMMMMMTMVWSCKVVWSMAILSIERNTCVEVEIGDEVFMTIQYASKNIRNIDVGNFPLGNEISMSFGHWGLFSGPSTLPDMIISLWHTATQMGYCVLRSCAVAPSASWFGTMPWGACWWRRRSLWEDGVSSTCAAQWVSGYTSRS